MAAKVSTRSVFDLDITRRESKASKLRWAARALAILSDTGSTCPWVGSRHRSPASSSRRLLGDIHRTALNLRGTGCQYSKSRPLRGDVLIAPGRTRQFE